MCCLGLAMSSLLAPKPPAKSLCILSQPRSTLFLFLCFYFLSLFNATRPLLVHEVCNFLPSTFNCRWFCLFFIWWEWDYLRPAVEKIWRCCCIFIDLDHDQAQDQDEDGFMVLVSIGTHNFWDPMLQNSNLASLLDGSHTWTALDSDGKQNKRNKRERERGWALLGLAVGIDLGLPSL